jgi:hypothetical protein
LRAGELRPAALLENVHVVERIEAEFRPLAPVFTITLTDCRADGGALPGIVGGAAAVLAAARWSRQAAPAVRQLTVEIGMLGMQLGRRSVSALANSRENAFAGPGPRRPRTAVAGKLVEVEQLIDVEFDALDPDCSLHRIGIVPNETLVQHVIAP